MANKIYTESPESERKYRRLAKLGKELGVPIPQVFIEMEVVMPDGKVIHHHKQRSHSWTRNAYNGLFVNLAGKCPTDGAFGPGLISYRDTGGTIRSGSIPLWIDSGGVTANLDAAAVGYAGYRATASVATRGIVVGSGVNAESFEDYKLQTPIGEGTGAGQLSHAQSEAHVITYNAGTLTLSNALRRYFNNNSGGAINVNEVGIIWYQVQNGLLYMLSRDKLGATVTVPDTGQLKVTYTISLVYPA